MHPFFIHLQDYYMREQPGSRVAMAERRKSVTENEEKIRAHELKYPNPEDDPDHNIVEVTFEKHLVYDHYLVGEPIEKMKLADMTPKVFY